MSTQPLVYMVVQTDVFSFGVIMYEVLHRYAMLPAVAARGTEQELDAYAWRVSRGYRPQIHEEWSGPVQNLIEVRCLSRRSGAACEVCQQPEGLRVSKAAREVSIVTQSASTLGMHTMQPRLDLQLMNVLMD